MVDRLVPSAYATVDAAWTASADGDAIVIENSATYSLTATLTLPAGESRTVRAVDGQKPAIQFNDAPFTLSGSGSTLTLTNLIVANVHPTTNDVFGTSGNHTYTATNCEFTGPEHLCDQGLAGSFDRCFFKVVSMDNEAGTSTADFINCLVVDLTAAFVTTGNTYGCTFHNLDNTDSWSVWTAGNLRNCMALQCTTTGTKTFDVPSAGLCTHNHHHLCSSSGGSADSDVFDADVLTAIQSGDPLVYFRWDDTYNLTADDGDYYGSQSQYIPRATSPLLNAGATGLSLGADYYGNTRGDTNTSTIGAFEGVTFLSAAWESLTTIRATFRPTIAAASIAADKWTLTTAGGGAAVSVVAVTLDVGTEDPQYLLTVYPEATPGETYTLTATDPERASWPITVAAPLSKTVAVSASYAHTIPATPPYRALKALMNMAGRQLQKLHGVPVTRLESDLAPGAKLAVVTTTFGFAAAGSVFAGGFKLNYTSSGDGALLGLTDDAPRVVTIPAGTKVYYDARSYIPSSR